MLTHPIDHCPACRKSLGPAEIIERWCEDCGRPTDKPEALAPRVRKRRLDRPQNQAA